MLAKKKIIDNHFDRKTEKSDNEAREFLIRRGGVILRRVQNYVKSFVNKYATSSNRIKSCEKLKSKKIINIWLYRSMGGVGEDFPKPCALPRTAVIFRNIYLFFVCYDQSCEFNTVKNIKNAQNMHVKSQQMQYKMHLNWFLI